MVLEQGPESPPLVTNRKPVRALHAGTIVFAGVVVANLGNYAFQLVAARSLGPAPYGDLATLLVLVSLVGLPLGGLQLWIARHVAEYEAVGDTGSAHWLIRRATLYTTSGAAITTLALLVLARPVQHALGIGSFSAVAVTALVTFPAVLTPVVWGLAQGLERFTLISVMVASAPTLRIAVVVVGFAVGFGVAGAMSATLASNLLTLVIPLWLLRGWLRPAAKPAVRVRRRQAAASLLPVLTGLLAITSLTTIDVVVAKRALGDHATGIYSSASLAGRVILYLPSAIVTVLLPRVAARTAGNRSSLDLLGRSLAVTIGFCTITTLLYAAIPDVIIQLAFGSAYDDAAPLLWRFGVAMSGFALLNVLFVYHLGRREHSMSWILGLGAVCQVAAFTVFHNSGRQLVAVDIIVAIALLFAHEATTHWTLTRALLVGLRRVP
jgi:O-antigen/teichoic acid export membrane protein